MHIPARRMAALTIPALLTLAVSTLFAQQVDVPGGGPGATIAPATMPADAGAIAPAATMPGMDTTAATAPATMPADTQAATQPRLIMPHANATQKITPSTTVSFSFKDATVDSILDYMSESLGFTIIVDPGVRLDSRIPKFISVQPIDAAEAVTQLNNVLKPLKYGSIQSDRGLRVAPLDTIKAGNVPVHVGADPEKIANSEDIITQVIPLQSVDAVKLRADLAPMLNPDAVMTANTGSNSIIVTDSSSNIKRMVEIIASLDEQRVAVSDIRTYQLKYASATNAATLINSIFKTDATTGAGAGGGGGFGGRGGFGGGGGFGRGGFGPGAQGAQAPDTGGSEIAGKVNASSDDRTNTLVVVGPKSTLETIDKIVATLDNDPAQDQIFFIYNLKNGVATDIEPVLNTLFGNSTSGSSSASKTGFSGQSFANTSSGSSSSSGAFGTSGSSSRGGSGSSSSRGGSGSSLGGSSGGGAFGSSGSSSSTANRGTTSGSSGSRSGSSTSTAVAALQGEVFVVSNPDTNSLLVTTKANLKSQVIDIIDSLDRPVPQVLIKILIAEVTHSDTDDIGVEFSAVNARVNGKGITAGTDFGIASQTGGLVVGLTEGDVTATLRALAGNNKLDVLSRPYILASDNQLASMIVGQEVPIVTNTQITDTGNTINSVSYQNVGIILDVTPHINPEGLVILDVEPQVSQLDTGGGVAISSTASAPIIDIRAAQTRVGIKNGETIIIGGLMQDQKTQVIQKLPILGDIPWLGMLFKRTQNSKTKTELLIFLTPQVAQVPNFLKGMSKDEEMGLKLVPNAVTPGTYQDHIRGLERGSTIKPVDPSAPPVSTTQPNALEPIPPRQP